MFGRDAADDMDKLMGVMALMHGLIEQHVPGLLKHSCSIHLSLMPPPSKS